MAAEKGVFKDERYLQPDYLPEVLPHREKEINEIAYSLQSASQGKRPENVFIIGGTGTGKTCTVKYVLNQLKEYSDSSLPIYINCWENGTRMAIINKIAISLNEMLPRRGISYDEAIERIVEVIKKREKIPIVVLDEVDRLFADGEEKILYDLSRAYEMHSIPLGVICISNRDDALAKLDRRIKSSLSPHEMIFKNYSLDELMSILKERSKYAFLPGAINEKVLEKCAEEGVKNNGDARYAINLLRLAGKNAERENKTMVEVSHLLESIPQEKNEGIKEKLNHLTETELKIIKLLSEREFFKSAELYVELMKQGIAERTARKYIEKLENEGIIKTKLIEGKGKWRHIWLKKEEKE